MTTKIKELKQELKTLATHIRKAKNLTKECYRKRDFKEYETWAISQDLYRTGWGDNKFALTYSDMGTKYRYMHIAYCLLRGRTYEQIENKVKPGNEPKWTLIENVMKEYREVEEIVCSEVSNG